VASIKSEKHKMPDAKKARAKIVHIPLKSSPGTNSMGYVLLAAGIALAIGISFKIMAGRKQSRKSHLNC
jgi:hypothetical protein